MHVGIDIGTTHISASLFKDMKHIEYTGPTFENRRIKSTVEGGYEQDPQAIENSVNSIIASIKEPIDSITITGQVHGILYYDKDYNCVSPLATWLDQRSNIIIDGKTISEHFERETQHSLPAGFGILTHYANMKLHCVPPTAVGFCGILEYITGRLIGRPLTKSDPSCLGTLGCFDPVRTTFDEDIVNHILQSNITFPMEKSDPFEIAGYTKENIPVTYPVGDNQAGFFAIVDDIDRSALVSLGTSGQLSLFSESTKCSSQMELREFLGLGYLHVGAIMTAGKAYERLKDLFQEIYVTLHGSPVEDEVVFDAMKKSCR